MTIFYSKLIQKCYSKLLYLKNSLSFCFIHHRSIACYCIQHDSFWFVVASRTTNFIVRFTTQCIRKLKIRKVQFSLSNFVTSCCVSRDYNSGTFGQFSISRGNFFMSSIFKLLNVCISNS